MTIMWANDVNFNVAPWTVALCVPPESFLDMGATHADSDLITRHAEVKKAALGSKSKVRRLARREKAELTRVYLKLNKG